MALAAAVTGAAGLALAWMSLPDVSRLRGAWPDTTSYMRLRIQQASEAGRELTLRYRPVPLDRIPESLRRAVRVSEDAAFYQHPGLDVHEVRAALEGAWRERRAPRGASTITQQLARNLYLTPERTLSRKLREAMIAVQLESELSKRRILELYLNVIEFGDGVFGVQAGAAHYFGVPVERLSRRQAAELAAAIPAPRSDNPATRTREFLWRAGLAYRRAFADADSATAGSPPSPPGPAVSPLPAPGPVEDTGPPLPHLPPADSAVPAPDTTPAPGS